ncbi:MAG: BrnA antitoxin family protein [Zoogloeaceae bacterium]|jgi:uncharacterized protein (DUF4415 family)|nr:BrnA antitoxin family protein [Zoogloeaceae bacterium]
MSTVHYEADKLPPDPTRKARLAAAFAKPESEIDFSDIPEADAAFWASAVRIGREKPRKRQTTIRLDEDVIEWFKGAGRGYQSRMNAILRAVMLRDTRA